MKFRVLFFTLVMMPFSFLAMEDPHHIEELKNPFVSLPEAGYQQLPTVLSELDLASYEPECVKTFQEIEYVLFDPKPTPGQINCFMSILQRLAEKGFAPALYWIGLIHFRGWGQIKQDVSLGKQYLLSAAEHKYSHAQLQLSLLYLHEAAVPRATNTGIYQLLPAAHFLNVHYHFPPLYHDVAKIQSRPLAQENCLSSKGQLDKLARIKKQKKETIKEIDELLKKDKLNEKNISLVPKKPTLEVEKNEIFQEFGEAVKSKNIDEACNLLEKLMKEANPEMLKEIILSQEYKLFSLLPAKNKVNAQLPYLLAKLWEKTRSFTAEARVALVDSYDPDRHQKDPIEYCDWKIHSYFYWSGRKGNYLSWIELGDLLQEGMKVKKGREPSSFFYNAYESSKDENVKKFALERLISLAHLDDENEPDQKALISLIIIGQQDKEFRDNFLKKILLKALLLPENNINRGVKENLQKLIDAVDNSELKYLFGKFLYIHNDKKLASEYVNEFAEQNYSTAWFYIQILGELGQIDKISAQLENIKNLKKDCCYEKENVEENIKAAVQTLDKFAQKGGSYSYLLYQLYSSGVLIEKNEAVADDYLNQAANLKFPEALWQRLEIHPKRKVTVILDDLLSLLETQYHDEAIQKLKGLLEKQEFSKKIYTSLIEQTSNKAEIIASIAHEKLEKRESIKIPIPEEKLKKNEPSPFDVALQRYKEGKSNEALISFQKIKDGLEGIKALACQGFIYHEQGNYDDCLSCLEAFLKENCYGKHLQPLKLVEKAFEVIESIFEDKKYDRSRRINAIITLICYGIENAVRRNDFSNIYSILVKVKDCEAEIVDFHDYYKKTHNFFEKLMDKKCPREVRYCAMTILSALYLNCSVYGDSFWVKAERLCCSLENERESYYHQKSLNSQQKSILLILENGLQELYRGFAQVANQELMKTENPKKSVKDELKYLSKIRNITKFKDLCYRLAFIRVNDPDFASQQTVRLAFKDLETLKQEGETRAMMLLAAYYIGEIPNKWIKPNGEYAIKLLKQLADEKEIDDYVLSAKKRLAQYYGRGECGLQKNLNTAVEYLLQAYDIYNVVKILILWGFEDDVNQEERKEFFESALSCIDTQAEDSPIHILKARIYFDALGGYENPEAAYNILEKFLHPEYMEKIDEFFPGFSILIDLNTRAAKEIRALEILSQYWYIKALDAPLAVKNAEKYAMQLYIKTKNNPEDQLYACSSLLKLANLRTLDSQLDCAEIKKIETECTIALKRIKEALSQEVYLQDEGKTIITGVLKRILRYIDKLEPGKQTVLLKMIEDINPYLIAHNIVEK